MVKSFIEVKKELSREQMDDQHNLRSFMKTGVEEQVDLTTGCSSGEDEQECYGLLSLLDVAEDYYYHYKGLKRKLTLRFSRNLGVGRCEGVSEIYI